MLSFAGFAERGGRPDEHRDGWGIAFSEGARGHTGPRIAGELPPVRAGIVKSLLWHSYAAESCERKHRYPLYCAIYIVLTTLK
jgi:hypothetical protein